MYRKGKLQHIKMYELEMVEKAEEAERVKVEKEKQKEKKNRRPARPVQEPDLPIEVQVSGTRRKMPFITDLKPVKVSKEGVKVKLFSADRNCDPFEFNFKVPESIVGETFHICFSLHSPLCHLCRQNLSIISWLTYRKAWKVVI